MMVAFVGSSRLVPALGVAALALNSGAAAQNNLRSRHAQIQPLEQASSDTRSRLLEVDENESVSEVSQTNVTLEELSVAVKQLTSQVQTLQASAETHEREIDGALIMSAIAFGATLGLVGVVACAK